MGTAAAAVLTRFFGGRVDLRVGSDALRGTINRSNSFDAAVTEAGPSRIYAGQHTRLDHDADVVLGPVRCPVRPRRVGVQPPLSR